MMTMVMLMLMMMILIVMMMLMVMVLGYLPLNGVVLTWLLGKSTKKSSLLLQAFLLQLKCF